MHIYIYIVHGNKYNKFELLCMLEKKKKHLKNISMFSLNCKNAVCFYLNMLIKSV